MKWRYFGASTIGSSHVLAGSPCQDNYSFESFLARNDDEYFISIISDGAGSASCGEIGSRIICDSFLKQLKQQIIENGKCVSSFSHEDIAQILDITVAEIKRIADVEGKSIRDFAGTLLGAVVSENSVMYFQIGDGAIIYSNNDSDFQVVFWPEQGEYANETFFLTDTDAKGHLRFHKQDSAPCRLSLFSDGLQHLLLVYRDRSVHAPFFTPKFICLEKTAAGHVEALSVDLGKFLVSKAINERTDDDKTLIMASQGLPVNITHVLETSETSTVIGDAQKDSSISAS